MENSKTTGEEKKLKKILLVEDDENTRALYFDVLKEKGFEVIEAVDGVDGLDKATKEQPDLIFTGIMMPRMDGFAMFDALKKNVATSKIPVAISSHMGREEDQKKAVEIGAKDFIPRDFNSPKQVADRLAALLSANSYRIKINKTELDAPKLLSDEKISGEMKCYKCGEDMDMVLNRKQELVAKFVCSKCGAEA